MWSITGGAGGADSFSSVYEVDDMLKVAGTGTETVLSARGRNGGASAAPAGSVEDRFMGSLSSDDSGVIFVETGADTDLTCFKAEERRERNDS